VTTTRARCTAALAAAVAVAATTACGRLSVRVPDGPWVPDDTVAAAYHDATSACRGIRTWSAEVGVSGRAAGGRLRGRLVAGFERPGSARLEGVAPFGAPAFVLTARADRAVLVLPRDRRVLDGAPMADVMAALAGVARGTDDLVALLGGCAATTDRVLAGFRQASGWVRADLDGGLSAYLRRDAEGWRLLRAVQAADRGMEAWTVEYAEFASGFPAAVRLHDASRTDLRLRISQRDVNTDLSRAAFDAPAHDGYLPMTLDDLRAIGPLGEGAAATRR
jgi:hypothetical protein